MSKLIALMIVSLAISGCGQSGGSGSDSPRSIIVTGDSLCSQAGSWPDILAVDGYSVVKDCAAGRKLGGVDDTTLKAYFIAAGRGSIFIQALGANNALTDKDAFELEYRQQVETAISYGMTVIVLTPPLTQWTTLQQGEQEIGDRIRAVANDYNLTVLSMPMSDAADGIHYTLDAQAELAALVESALPH